MGSRHKVSILAICRKAEVLDGSDDLKPEFAADGAVRVQEQSCPSAGFRIELVEAIAHYDELRNLSSLVENLADFLLVDVVQDM